MEGIPLSQIWGNTGAPYALAAATFNQLLKSNSALHAEKIELNQTITVAAWRTQDNELRILAGNLEEGLRDDADFSRTAALAIPHPGTPANGATCGAGRLSMLKRATCESRFRRQFRFCSNPRDKGCNSGHGPPRFRDLGLRSSRGEILYPATEITG